MLCTAVVEPILFIVVISYTRMLAFTGRRGFKGIGYSVNDNAEQDIASEAIIISSSLHVMNL